MTNSDDSIKNEFDVKQSRLDHPTGWMKVTRYETVRYIIDALLESPPGHKFNKSELSRRTGMSREAIRNHLPKLEKLGVVEKIHDGGWAEYMLNEDARVTTELLHLNNAVNAVEAGQSKEFSEKKFELSTPDFHLVSAPNYDGATIQPYSLDSFSQKSTVAHSTSLEGKRTKKPVEVSIQ